MRTSNTENMATIVKFPFQENLNFKIPTMLKIKEVQELTGLSYQYIINLCKTNKIVHKKAGTRYLINLEKLVEYLNSNESSNVL